MVIRSLIIRLASRLVAQVRRLWLSTLRVHCEHLEPSADPGRHGDKGQLFCAGPEDRVTLEHCLGRDIDILVSDGPLGPRRALQPGEFLLASRTGKPLIPVGLAYERPWRLAWKKLVLPRLFSRVVICLGPATVVPAAANTEALEQQRQRISALMQESTRRAEALLRRWRKGESLPLVSPEAKALEAMPLRKSA